MSAIPAPGTQTAAAVQPIDDTLGEYLRVIETTIANHPRSLQKAIGPSEVGQACARRLGYQLLGHPERPQQPNWKATIGTAVHSWLEHAFDHDNLAWAQQHGRERWLVETRVTVGSTPTLGDITGSCDLYDTATGVVFDHKVVGPAQLKHYKADGPSPQYRTQAHLYGRGWVLAGWPVTHVCICFLPRNGDLADAYQWHEPWSEQIALDGLTRLDTIAATCALLGDKAPALLPTADVFCVNCPFYKAGSTDPAVGCPGHDMPRQPSQSPLTLIR